ncbi:MAG: SMI1/KNR4 family protein, partial [Rhizobiales bacterium]|nr:SMI1/KNR4 family protein [Hyphomicrobiales bacterium]
WNSPDGWRKLYGLENDPILFFAQDLFANQFGVASNKVFRLDSEWGQLEEHSANLADWAEMVLKDYDFETGWSLGREWQLANYPIDASMRLLAKKPIVLGGDYVSDNFLAIPTSQCMQQLGLLFNEIKYKPDGTPVRVKNWLRK